MLDKPAALGPTAGQLPALTEFFNNPAASQPRPPPSRHRHATATAVLLPPRRRPAATPPRPPLIIYQTRPLSLVISHQILRYEDIALKIFMFLKTEHL